LKYFKRIYTGPHWKSDGYDWYRGYIFRAGEGDERLEEYIKLDKYKYEWGFTHVENLDKNGSPWFKTQYYAFCAGTGKGSCFEEITEAEAFIELL